jgi:hypothetical protein
MVSSPSKVSNDALKYGGSRLYGSKMKQKSSQASSANSLNLLAIPKQFEHPNSGFVGKAWNFLT